MKNNKYSLVIVGGGAAGLSAAITYMQNNTSVEVLVLESMKECGRKILATGNGRCNISNKNAIEYHTISDFFESIGIIFRVEEDGRAYPISNRALSVRDALVSACQKLDVKIQTESRVTQISKSEEFFNVEYDKGDIHEKVQADCVLIATGGKAGPMYGSNGDGFAFARKIGHKVNTVFPALVPINYASSVKAELTQLKGVRGKAKATLLVNREIIEIAEGEIQFTADALSGIMIFDLSRKMPKRDSSESSSTTKNVIIEIDLAPDVTKKRLKEILDSNLNIGLRGIIDERLATYIEEKSKNNIDVMIELVKNFEIPVTETKGWKDAQVTKGGVSLDEINALTGESLICKGLFFAGEVIDLDFICGGYNLSFAWSSGIRVGEWRKK